VHGADARSTLIFKVTQVGAEFWATWGKGVSRDEMKAAARNN
jgi:hypothetical protein